ncbi:ribosomal RNA small subunit methyltransferase C [Marinobacterium zhoushanense]|uniref:Ribosomal RNA small subunit methyltransferase C n=1 Tax=Marinobacterium zhoushanense TaxID=1679163 RepID=A0ABQ1KH43_9GAMM|nr:methyltransferase [Marinobacterium zhoushanense]GGC00045.1 ribosomal RNA small subunit methyltransferase C [Marinobacterium zhoushanense]
MIDPVLNLLLQDLRQSSEHALWLVDENIPADLCPARSGLPVVGNRFDLIQALRARGWQAQFSDFDLSTRADGSLQRIIYRVSKEKPVVHYLINQAARLLQQDGELILLGDKSEGIKTYSRKAQQRLGGSREERKQGSAWRAVLTRGNHAGEALDDQEYCRLRPLELDTGAPYLTKPGLYGWNKVDRGSAFLLEQLPAMLGQPLPLCGRVLDLGCGFGYLALNACDASTKLTCTDNNAAALYACRENLAHRGLRGETIASDAGRELAPGFDTILCNPPFHAGFGIEGDLTDRFLEQTRRLLAPGGSACFVVNLHIPLERKAQGRFARIRCHADNGHFKLIHLSQAR